MKTVIFSDTHLTHIFEPAKFRYLQDLISSADRVIINGDFWDYYLTTWEKFLNSPWQQLFPLLKSKNTVYIYGNHDQEMYSDQRVKLFSQKQTYEYLLLIGDKTLHIEHGHRIFPTLELQYPFLKHKFFVRVGTVIDHMLIAVFGKKYLAAWKNLNTVLKKYSEEHLAGNEVLVCGHTHVAEFNLAGKLFNSGLNRYGYAQALSFDGGTMELLDTRYR